MGPRDAISSRQRVLAALGGERTDRVPVHFDLGPFRETLRRAGVDDPSHRLGVDLVKIWFVPSAAAQAERQPETGGPRVGNREQVANYRRWGYHPERIDHRHPLIEATGTDEIVAYDFPVVRAAADIARLRDAVASAHAGGQAVAGQVPHLGGVLFETAYRLRGLDNLLEDFRSRPRFAAALLDRIADAACRNVEELAAAGVDIVLLGDDIGTPTSMLVAPEMWREWLKPGLARIIAGARAVAPDVAVAYHSDGYYLPVVEDLIEIGVGILNPVQPDCMDPAVLRERFGDRLTLWGTVGTATLLAFSSPETVRQEVRLRIETLGGRGRLILAPAYDLEDNVPLENVLAFFDACRG